MAICGCYLFNLGLNQDFKILTVGFKPTLTVSDRFHVQYMKNLWSRWLNECSGDQDSFRPIDLFPCTNIGKGSVSTESHQY